MNKEVQEVIVAVGICGDYCSFDEIMFKLLYDYTNNKALSFYTEEEVDKFLEEEYSEYSDYEIRDAILVDGKYYVEW